MKPSQKELNEFVLDLIEFMGKHFTDRFDKTRVAGGNEGVSVRVRRTGAASELEITTDRLDPEIDFASARWQYREYTGSKDALFERILSDLTAVFMDRLVVVSGSKAGQSPGRRVFRDVSEAEAVAQYRARHPECDMVVLKKWTEPEAVIPVRGT